MNTTHPPTSPPTPPYPHYPPTHIPSPPPPPRRQAAHEFQKSGPEALQLEDIDFGRRYALEKEMRAQGGCLSGRFVAWNGWQKGGSRLCADSIWAEMRAGEGDMGAGWARPSRG